MKITAISSITKQPKEYDLDQLNITGNSAEETEVCVTAVKPESNAVIYTSDNTYLTKFKKLITSNPKSWKITQVVERADGTISGVMLQAPKKCLSFRAVEKTGRVMTDAEKAMAAERLRAIRSRKQS